MAEHDGTIRVAYFKNSAQMDEYSAYLDKCQEDGTKPMTSRQWLIYWGNFRVLKLKPSTLGM